jgi:hypothetical protein
MLRKVFSFGGMLLLAGAAILATPGSSQAQRGGGGHGGGGHIGGAHFGGGHFGGARFGGYRGGLHYGYHHYSRPFYGSYGYYPYYDTYPYLGSNPTYNPGAYNYYGDETPSYPDDYTSGTPPDGSYQSFYPPVAAQPDTSVHITVNVPATARCGSSSRRRFREADSTPTRSGLAGTKTGRR